MIPGGYKITPFSENCALVQFENHSIEDANEKAIRLFNRLKSHPVKGFKESIPAYDSLAVVYEPEKSRFEEICGELEKMISVTDDLIMQGKTHTIPVHYGGNEGPDMLSVAKENKISPEELIQLHTEREYRVFMVGFTGGFPYLGLTQEKLTTGRKAVPEISVPAGSVALAGNQTGIYPSESPGAWKIIGRTSYEIFNPHKEDPAIIKPGDKIKFVKV